MNDADQAVRILVVDDSLTVRMSLQELLREAGYRVLLAGGGAECMEILGREAVDVMLLDLIMPGQSGRELLCHIKDQPELVSIPVLLLTAVSDREELVACLDQGADDFVVKPWDQRELLGRLRSLVRLKRALDAARSRAEEVRRILDATREGIQGLDARGLATFVNPAAAAMLGREPGEVLGKPFHELFYSGRAADPEGSCGGSPVAAVLRDGTPTERFEDVFSRKDGTSFPVEVSSEPIRDPDGSVAGAVVTFRDVSEARALQAQILQGQKLESIGRLAAGIAHEINTPVQFVGDNLQFLEESFGDLSKLLERYRSLREASQSGGASPQLLAEVAAAEEEADLPYLAEEIPSAIGQARSGVGRVAEIVQAMREFSHPGSKEKAPVDLNQAIESTVTVSRSEWHAAAEVELDLDPDLPPVPCLRAEFNQVMLNLVVNAAQSIEEARGETAGEKGRIEIRSRRVEGWAEIEVRDSGAGMPEEVRGRVFDPFFTTKEVGRGTGQGLAIARSVVVEKHAGSIEVESEVGRGTTFRIRLPLEAARSDAGGTG